MGMDANHDDDSDMAGVEFMVMVMIPFSFTHWLLLLAHLRWPSRFSTSRSFLLLLLVVSTTTTITTTPQLACLLVKISQIQPSLLTLFCNLPFPFLAFVASLLGFDHPATAPSPGRAGCYPPANHHER